MENKEKSNIWKIVLIIAIIVLLGVIAKLCFGYIKNKTTSISNPIVTMEIQDYGTVKIELYPDKAPNTVKNFVKLAQNGYYDGLKFHRVVKDFMIQSGDSLGTGAGGATLDDLNNTKKENEEKNEEEEKATENENSVEENEIEESQEQPKEYNIVGEMLANGYEKNDLNLTEGVIAMARADYTRYASSYADYNYLAEKSYNSAGSQFFIMTTNEHTNLSGYYTGFGKVIEGMDVVKKIAEVEVKVSDDSESTGNTEQSVPVTDVIVSSVKVDTFGIDYGMPETLEPFDLMTWFYKTYYGM